MRITYAGPVPPLKGGIAQHGGRLVEALRAAGHEVRVISWRVQYPGFLFRGEQVVPKDGDFEGARFSMTWWSPLSWRAAGRAARDSDLFVFPWVTAAHALPNLALLSAAGAGPRKVAIVHNPLPHEPQPFAKQLLRAVIARTDGVLVHSQVVADELRALASPKSVVVTPMPSLIPLEPTPLPPRPPLKLLFLGFVRPYKGLDDGLAALKILVERGMNVELTVAGEFWEPVDTWRRRVSELGLAERVHLRPGYASDAEVAELLASHHAVLAPYRSATQSGVVPLAFAAGRPVVATAVGGIPERIVDGGPAGNGVLSPPRDPSALAVAIERVGQGLEQLATGARAGAVGWSAVGDDLLRALAPPG